MRFMPAALLVADTGKSYCWPQKSRPPRMKRTPCSRACQMPLPAMQIRMISTISPPVKLPRTPSRCQISPSTPGSPTWSGSAAPMARSPFPRSAMRPPGAQISSMLCYAHDFDLYSAWAQLMVHGQFRAAGTHLVGRDGVPARPGKGACLGRAWPRQAASRGELPRGRVALAGAGPAVLGQLRGRRLRHSSSSRHAVVIDAMRNLVTCVRVELG